MNSEFDHEKAAKEDIVARPEVTAATKAQENPAGAKEPLKITGIQEEVGPDNLEIAAGKVVSNSLDDLKTMFGMEKDADFTLLLSETLSGSFAAIRAMSGMPWVRFAIAASAIGVSFIPAYLRYSKTKKEKKDNEE